MPCNADFIGKLLIKLIWYKIVKAQNDALEKRLREYVDLKFEVLDTKFTDKVAIRYLIPKSLHYLGKWTSV